MKKNALRQPIDYRKLRLIRWMIPLLLASLLLVSTMPAVATVGITSVSPSSVINDQSVTLTITGSEFVDGSIASVNGVGNLATSFIDAQTLNALLPAGVVPGVYAVGVTNPDATSASLPNALTVVAPTPGPTATTNPQATATPQPTLPYERPLIIIQSYSPNADRLTLGSEFALNIRVYNAGQKYANNVVATFTMGDLIPRGTGGVVALGGIAPDNRNDFSQPLQVKPDLWGQTVATVVMTLSYTDGAGVAYTENFNLTVPLVQPSIGLPTATRTPTPTGTPRPLVRPELVITNYTINISPLQPGVQFTLEITLENLGNALAKRVIMIIGGGSSGSANGSTPDPGGISGGSGEFSNFAPLGSSNVQSLGDLAPGQKITASQILIVNVSTNPGAYPMKLSFAYLTEEGQNITDDQIITLLVYSLPNVDLGFYRDPDPFFSGQPGMLPLQIVNLGRKTAVLGNMRVSAPEGVQVSNASTLVGALDAGGYFTLDTTVFPIAVGPLNLFITVDYTDDFNQPQVISKTITVEVMEGFMPDSGGPYPVPGEGESGGPSIQQPETFWQKVVRFIRGMIGLDSTQQTSGGEIVPGDITPGVEPVEGGKPVSPPVKGP